MDRGPDRRPPGPPEDRYGSSRGQSYRPRSPPGRGGFRPRSPGPPPRGYAPDPYDHRGPPPQFRRRSRSPPPYRRDERYAPPRGHSPPRRGYERDMGYRGPPPPQVRDERYRERSPLRGEKRSRDVSPLSARGRYSPPPAKRERLASPARSRYSDVSRDRSLPRRRSPYGERRASPIRSVTRDYRPGSRSPMRPAERIDPRAVDNWRRRSPSPRRGTDSGATSRRPSPPPVHPSRLGVISDAPRPTGRGAPPVQPRSPPRRPASPHRDPSQLRAPPSGPISQPNLSTPQQPRPPPSGPKPTIAPPSAPRGSLPTSSPATPRTETPLGPRATRPAPTTIPSGPRAAPTGPYRATSQQQTPSAPRAARFPAQPVAPRVHPALASVPVLLDEGKKFPDLFDRSALEKLERQTEEVRRVAEEKQARKRRGLREWERLEREVRLAELRAELAAESLARLEGGEVVASF